MSHVVKQKVEVKDKQGIADACKALGLGEPVEGQHTLFSGQASGVGVRLPGWNYPAVFDTEKGEVRYDNYGGTWGDQKELDRFIQRYGVEVGKRELAKSGWTATEERTLEDGTIEVELGSRW